MNSNYEKILYIHRPSTKYSPMSIHDRAAQFAPFAALSGHEESLIEIGRITQEKRELFEDTQSEVKYFLDALIQKLSTKKNKYDSYPIVSLTYFKADPKKDGGQYHSIKTTIKKFNEEHQTLISIDNLSINIQDIVDGSFVDR